MHLLFSNSQPVSAPHTHALMQPYWNVLGPSYTFSLSRTIRSLLLLETISPWSRVLTHAHFQHWAHRHPFLQRIFTFHTPHPDASQAYLCKLSLLFCHLLLNFEFSRVITGRKEAGSCYEKMSQKLFLFIIHESGCVAAGPGSCLVLGLNFECKVQEQFPLFLGLTWEVPHMDMGFSL